ncbi:MAG: hypothetical protein HY854_06090 [Burkholderiales bacterium]|nr:hypothetical protein [Burkholderiales bacterium]
MAGSGLGSKLGAKIAAATDAAKAKAASGLQAAKEMAANGAKAVKAGVAAVLESGLASTVAVAGAKVLGGPVAGLIAQGVKSGYDYALKGEKKYDAADPYLDQDLKHAAQLHCGGDAPAAKARRKREREAMISAGKASGSPAKKAAAERLERDMVGVERARLSKHSYDAYDPTKAVNGKPPPPPVGFLDPSPSELEDMGITDTMLAPPGSTFRAKVYKVDPKVGSIPPEYVMAFRGTETKQDWTQANIPQGLGRPTDHYNRSMELGRLMAESGKSAEFTGHSLGGGLASAAAVVTGMPATTQNSAGLHDKTTAREGTPLNREEAKKIVNAYRIDGVEKTEILSSLNKLPLVPDAIGTPRTLEPPKAGVSRLGLHSIDAVIDSIEQQKTEDQQVLSPR